MALLPLLTLVSCSSEEDGVLMPREVEDLAIDVTLPGGSFYDTRANTNDDNDHWTYRSFEIGDQLGFYSQSGNYRIDEGRGPINNALLTCEKSKDGWFHFRANDVQISQQFLNASSVFFYFPYDAGISSPGMELRESAVGIDNTTTLRCKDFLSGNGLDVSSLAKGSLSGQFVHTFSELIIMRGSGFDNPEPGKEGIYVVLKKPYTHIKATPQANPWKIKLSLENIYGSPTADNDPRRWQAWAGEMYAETGWDSGKPAWYVVLPSLPDLPTEIDYIELYDNDGNLQRVTSMSLMNGGRKVESGWRYPVEIQMNELIPTVYPYRIIPWNTNIDLTDERTRGINDIREFREWLTAYSSYVNNSANVDETLLRYGDRVVDTHGNFLYWHFYILNDINFRDAFTVGNPIIPVLKDVLDARSSILLEDGFQFANNRLSNLTGPLVGTLQGNGALENINITSTTLISNTVIPTGILANNMTGGLIDNCYVINGTLITNGNVGMGVGNATGGKIMNSNFSGLLGGTNSNPVGGYILGNSSDRVEITNNTSSVVFNNSSTAAP